MNDILITYQSQKEDKYFDRKSAKIEPKSIIRHIVAFANAEGGTLVIGIEDNGDITGFKYQGAKNIGDYEEAIYSLTHPNPIFRLDKMSVTNVNNEEDVILAIEIEPSHKRIVKAQNGDVYLRMGDNNIVFRTLRTAERVNRVTLKLWTLLLFQDQKGK